MNFEYFIAKRIASKSHTSFSSIIIKIASGATAISVAILLISTMVVEGFQTEIKSKIFGFWGHIQIVDYNTNKSNETIPFFYNDSLKADLNQFQEINYYQSFVNKAGIIKTLDQLEGVILKGVSHDFNWDFIQNHLIDGQVLNINDTSSYRDILISKTIANRLQLKVGDPLNIYFLKKRSIGRKLKVKGIYHTGLAEYDRIYCIVNAPFIQSINGWNKNEVSGIEIFLKDIKKIIPIDEKIFRRLPADLKSQNIMEIYPNIFDWINLTATNKDLILGLVIAVAALNMMTVLLILIIERTNMIGTLKALGMNSWSIQKVFLYHAAYIALFGLVLGNVLGLGLAYCQYEWHWMKMDEEAYYLDHVPIVFNWTKIILVNIIALVIINSLLIIPSYLVQRITPIKAIKFD